MLTDNELLEMVIQGEMMEDKNKIYSEAMNGDDDFKRIHHLEGQKALEAVLRYIKQQSS